VPSGNSAVRSPAVIVRPPSIARDPIGRPAAALASVIAKIRDVRLAAIAMRMSAG